VSPINEAKGKSKKKRKEVRIKETSFPFENFCRNQYGKECQEKNK